jgi:L,D-peptidoglycan transpeptidase YkuD (ErfK/YbiS/YcfS/YnhG family)
MRIRAVLAISAAVVVVGAGAVTVVGLSDAFVPRRVANAAVTAPAPTSPSASTDSAEALADGGIAGLATDGSTSPAATAASSTSPSSAAAPSTTVAAPTPPPAHPAAPAQPAAAKPAAPRTTAAPVAAAPVTGQALPLGYSTGTATRVITVVAAAASSTTATLQAWNKAPGGGWLKYGGAITAHLGSAGLTAHASESLSATPVGSFALSRSFGRLANPGTGLSYHQTSPADWWISQPGALYNTMQTCSGTCSFAQGNPNEHLYYETPYYNYAVVIEYNTAPVVQGAGSAFFLHVTDGKATAGCVAIPQANLVSIMQWLTPSAAPRILIGVG